MGQSRTPLKERGVRESHECERQLVGDRDPDMPLSATPEVGAQEGPDALALAVNDVESLALCARVGSRKREEVGAVIDVGRWDTREWTNHELQTTRAPTETREMTSAATPDPTRPQDGQVPAVLLGKAPCYPLLPRLGNCIAIPLVEIRRRLQRGTLVKSATDRAPVVDREAARQDQPTAATTRHRAEKPLRPGHRDGELQIVSRHHPSREMHEYVDAVERGLEVRRRPQIRAEDLDGGWPAKLPYAGGRSDECPHFVTARE